MSKQANDKPLTAALPETLRNLAGWLVDDAWYYPVGTRSDVLAAARHIERLEARVRGLERKVKRLERKEAE